MEALQHSLTISDSVKPDQFESLRRLALGELKTLDASFQTSLVPGYATSASKARKLLARMQKQHVLYMLADCDRLHTLRCLSNLCPNIAHLSALRSLSLTVVQTPHMLAGLYDVLAKLDLRQLTISCMAWHDSLHEELQFGDELPPVCETMRYLYDNVTRNGPVCPNLTELNITCIKCPTEPLLYPVMQTFPHLQDLTICSLFSRKCCELLKDIPSIHIHVPGAPIHDSLWIRTCFSNDLSQLDNEHLRCKVKSILFMHNGKVSVRDLTVFPMLQKLDIFITDVWGYEGPLETPCNWTYLTHLTLRSVPRKAFSNWWEVIDILQSHRLRSGELMEVIGASPRLTHLGLHNIIVDNSELEQVLRATGNQLKSFEASLTNRYDDESSYRSLGSAVERLEVVVMCAARYCTVLERFAIADESLVTLQYGLIPSDMREIRAAIRTLKRRLPALDMTSVENCARCMSRFWRIEQL